MRRTRYHKANLIFLPTLAFVVMGAVCKNELVAVLFAIGTWSAGMSLLRGSRWLGFLAAGTIGAGGFICFNELLGLALTALVLGVAVALIAELH